MSKKLEKVLEYLITNQEDKAKDLLHRVFIEKARAIHEELINNDEDDLVDDVTYGNEDNTYSDDLEDFSDDIEAEETMSEGEDDDMDFDDAEEDLDSEIATDEDADDMDIDADSEEDSMSERMSDFETALADLKAEFEKLESEVGGDSDSDEGEADEDEDNLEDFGDFDEEDEEDEGQEEDEEEEEEMDESWFDDLDESIELEKVAAPSGPEVGSGKYASPQDGKSPVNKAPTELMGAKPVQFDKGAVKSGFEREGAPSSDQLANIKGNRRKKAEDDTSKVSKEGDASAKLNKTKSEFGADTNKKSPLTQSPRK